MDSDSLATTLLFSVLGAYWLIVGLLFFRRDRSRRLEVIVEESKTASLRERVLATAIGRARKHVENVKVFTQFLQLLGLVFLEDVPWSNPNWLARVGQVTILDFGQLGGSFSRIGFWCFAGVYFVHFLVFFAVRFHNWRRGREVEARALWLIHRVLVEALFIPSMRAFLSLLHCERSAETGQLRVADADVTCWTTEHGLLFVLPGVLAVVVLYPVTLESVMDTEHHTYFVVPRYNAFFFIVQFMLVAVRTFLSERALWAIGVDILLIGLLLIVNFRLQPALGAGRYLNHWYSAVFAAAVWAGAIALVALGVDDSDNPAPLAVLFAGMPVVMALAYLASQRYEKTRDERKILSLREAARSGDVESQRLASKNMAILAMTDDKRLAIATQVLAELVAMFNNPAADEEVRINTARAIANLAANDECRERVFEMELLKSLLSMVNSRRKVSVEARRVAIAAVCNLAASPKLCGSIVEERQGLESIFDMMQSLDAVVRERAAVALLNIANCGVLAVEDALMRERYLVRIVRLCGARALHLQIVGASIAARLAERTPNVRAIIDAGALEPQHLLQMTLSSWTDVAEAGRRAVEALGKEGQAFIRKHHYHDRSTLDKLLRSRRRGSDRRVGAPSSAAPAVEGANVGAASSDTAEQGVDNSDDPAASAGDGGCCSCWGAVEDYQRAKANLERQATEHALIMTAFGSAEPLRDDDALGDGRRGVLVGRAPSNEKAAPSDSHPAPQNDHRRRKSGADKVGSQDVVVEVGSLLDSDGARALAPASAQARARGGGAHRRVQSAAAAPVAPSSSSTSVGGPQAVEPPAATGQPHRTESGESLMGEEEEKQRGRDPRKPGPGPSRRRGESVPEATVRLVMAPGPKPSLSPAQQASAKSLGPAAPASTPSPGSASSKSRKASQDLASNVKHQKSVPLSSPQGAPASAAVVSSEPQSRAAQPQAPPPTPSQSETPSSSKPPSRESSLSLRWATSSSAPRSAAPAAKEKEAKPKTPHPGTAATREPTRPRRAASASGRGARQAAPIGDKS